MIQSIGMALCAMYQLFMLYIVTKFYFNDAIDNVWLHERIISKK